MTTLEQEIVQIVPELKRYARLLTNAEDQAEDLVQDCVERALRKADLFQPGTNSRAWMFTMMRNLFINGKRREKVSARYVESVVHEHPDSAPASQLDRVYLEETLEALESLSAQEREAIQLLAIEERSHQDAAARTHMPVGTMKSRLSRGRSKLRSCMDSAGGKAA
ncbi:MAG: RNA polymerase subunit sigma [Rhodospirillaceae bacterium]|nr:RNA polymerase subunit sigma [Rhodospirillaceae bacterium]|tara:strand:- start:41 stop:538 length:498 start_codon:yes stop_codon:yes gene_type:complete